MPEMNSVPTHSKPIGQYPSPSLPSAHPETFGSPPRGPLSSLFICYPFALAKAFGISILNYAMSFYHI